MPWFEMYTKPVRRQASTRSCATSRRRADEPVEVQAEKSTRGRDRLLGSLFETCSIFAKIIKRPLRRRTSSATYANALGGIAHLMSKHFCVIFRRPNFCVQEALFRPLTFTRHLLKRIAYPAMPCLPDFEGIQDVCNIAKGGHVVIAVQLGYAFSCQAQPFPMTIAISREQINFCKALLTSWPAGFWVFLLQSCRPLTPGVYVRTQ